MRVDSKGFGRWVITFWIIVVCYFKGTNTTFRKLDLFPSSCEGEGDTYSVLSVRQS
jgi:hypothetical protein